MMPPKGIKRCQSLLPADILSDLPNNVIDLILLCLPCKEAVRTSILAKKWRYHWCRLTELTLDRSHWEADEDFLDPTAKFTKIIYQIVTLHEGHITKFTLDMSDLIRCPEIDFFIYFLSRNGIQHLVLHFPEDKLCKLPSSLFTCSQLRHLFLRDCAIYPPSAFKGFDRLISMELYEVTISSELLESLISHCPLLEQLVLNISEISDKVEIDAPMLRSFDFTGDTSCICLKNVPLLVKVSLMCYDSVEELDFTKVFESCPSLEHLVLDISNIEAFEEEGYETPTRLPFDLISVKQFCLIAVELEDSYKLAYALCFVRSFPCLEYLEIQVDNEGDSGTEESVELKRLSGVTFNHLKKIQLRGFRGRTSEMQLIELLLANSPVLERMLISGRSLAHEPLDTTLKVFAEVSNFPRSSPKAEINCVSY